MLNRYHQPQHASRNFHGSFPLALMLAQRGNMGEPPLLFSSTWYGKPGASHGTLGTTSQDLWLSSGDLVGLVFSTCFSPNIWVDWLVD